MRAPGLPNLTLSVFLVPPLLFFAPILWIAGRLGGYGSLFFRQTRVGLHGEPFTIVKFRTLNNPGRRSIVDPLFRGMRRLGLDELPQILCVVRGEMAFVGPRPLVAADLCPSEYGATPPSPELIRLRQSVRPGLTGPAQLCGAARARTDAAYWTMLDLDLWYVLHRSLRLDLTLILRTFLFVVSLGRIPYVAGQAISRTTPDPTASYHPVCRGTGSSPGDV